MVPFVAKVLESCADSRVSIFMTVLYILFYCDLTGINIAGFAVKIY